MKKSVLIVIPNFENRMREYLILPTLELCTISSVLKNNGISVDIIDMKINDYSIEDLNNKLNSYKPDYIVVDDNPQIHCNTIKVLKTIREHYKDKVKIVLRGEIATFIPKTTMKRNPEIDYIIRFMDDYALVNIIKSNGKNLSNIYNIVYRDNGKVIITEENQDYYDINDLPMPDRKLYEIDKYLKRDSETIVRSSRGCPGRCLFCIKTRFSKFKLFAMKRFCDEIEELLGYGFSTFFFSDDTFAFSQQRLEEFAEEVRKRKLKIKWTSNLRIKDISEERIRLMKELGAYRVFIGVETVNAKTSKLINKNLKVEEILSKIKILKKYDMQFHASFILGNPGDTEEDLEETIKFVKKIKPNVVTFNLIKLFPGLDLYENPDKYGIILKDKYWYEKNDWTREVVAGTKQLPPEVLEKYSKRMLWEFININD